MKIVFISKKNWFIVFLILHIAIFHNHLGKFPNIDLEAAYAKPYNLSPLLTLCHKALTSLYMQLAETS